MFYYFNTSLYFFHFWPAIKSSIWNEPSPCELLLVTVVISWVFALLYLTKLIFNGFYCCLRIFCWVSILDWLPWGSEFCLLLSSRYLLPDHCEHGSVYPSMHITNFPLNTVQLLAHRLHSAICSWYLLGGVDNVLVKMTAMSAKCVLSLLGKAQDSKSVNWTHHVHFPTLSFWFFLYMETF